MKTIMLVLCLVLLRATYAIAAETMDEIFNDQNNHNSDAPNILPEYDVESSYPSPLYGSIDPTQGVTVYEPIPSLSLGHTMQRRDINPAEMNVIPPQFGHEPLIATDLLAPGSTDRTYGLENIPQDLDVVDVIQKYTGDMYNTYGRNHVISPTFIRSVLSDHHWRLEEAEERAKRYINTTKEMELREQFENAGMETYYSLHSSDDLPVYDGSNSQFPAQSVPTADNFQHEKKAAGSPEIPPIQSVQWDNNYQSILPWLNDGRSNIDDDDGRSRNNANSPSPTLEFDSSDSDFSAHDNYDSGDAESSPPQLTDETCKELFAMREMIMATHSTSISDMRISSEMSKERIRY
eukprot:85378_1